MNSNKAKSISIQTPFYGAIRRFSLRKFQFFVKSPGILFEIKTMELSWKSRYEHNSQLKYHLHKTALEHLTTFSSCKSAGNSRIKLPT